jgi:hypothetical protein
MKHSLLIAIGLISLAGLSLAQPAEVATSRASLKTVAQAIQTELEGHGERIMGKDAYHWSTRLEKVEDCRAEFTVRITNNLADPTVHVESVSFSLGALDPYGIQMQKHWLQLPCAEREQCIFSTSTCSRKSANGVETDCTTASQNRVDAFALQFDGDADSAQRLQMAFRQAAESCRQPNRVTF